MKRNLLLLFSLLLSYSAIAQKVVDIDYEEKENGVIEFRYKKHAPGSYYFMLEFTKLENCTSSKTYKKVLKNNSGTLFKLRPSFKDKVISFSYKTRYIYGNPDPKIKKDITYVLPFKEGKTVSIISASNIGEDYFGSEKPIDWKSFIVYSKTQDSVYAMRKGIVVKIENEYINNESLDKSFTSKRNHILIEHPDGTVASYKGFEKDQIFVKLGQNVYPHTLLGKMDTFNKGNCRIDFNVYHYLGNLLDDNKSTLKDRIYKVKYLDPNFFINNEVAKIKDREDSLVSINKDILFQEFSKKEKRKYKKHPEDFK